MEFRFRNVNDAFKELVHRFSRLNLYPRALTETQSRNGKVLYCDEPVLIHYTSPRERVLFNEARNANPFFHLYEALWMLAGRNDVASLKSYVSTIGDFSDDGKTFNGAYGFRWRKANYEKHYEVYDGEATQPESWETSTDQLKVIISHFKSQPNSRRAVLQMWNVEDDLLKTDTSKDVCCNLSIMFSLREVYETFDTGGFTPWSEPITDVAKVRFLDMTVTNRSNDLVWGLLGANYVHFSMLQEYMAAHIGVSVGRYSVMTNNLHAYVERKDWKPNEFLSEYEQGGRNSDKWYGTGNYHYVPLVQDPKKFDEELQAFVNLYGTPVYNLNHQTKWQEPFFEHVAQPTLMAHWAYKLGGTQTVIDSWLERVKADDWRIVAREWIQRRQLAKSKKE